MKCAYVESFFDRVYRDGPAFDREDITAHITRCEHCRRRYEQWRRIAETLEDAPALEAPPAFYTRVMQSVAEQKKTSEKREWLLQWHPYPIPAVAATLLIFLFIGIPVLFHHPPVSNQMVGRETVSASPTAPELIIAHFEIASASARKVALVGDFNGWDTGKHQLIRKKDGTWTIDLPIRKGAYQYLFYIDDKRWQPDPHRKQTVPDGFGGYNTVIKL